MTTDVGSQAQATAVAVGGCPQCGFVLAAERSDAKTRCPECGTRVVLRWVVGQLSEGVPCNGECQYAHGPHCSCSCGGANHGRGYIRVEYVPQWVRDRDRARHAKKVADASTRLRTRREQAAAAAAERTASLLAQFPVLAELLEGGRYAEDWSFLPDMRRLLRTGQITPRQAEYTASLIGHDLQREWQNAERDFAAELLRQCGVAVPTGRTLVEGTIVHVKDVPGYRGRPQLRMLIVTDAGWKVWGTVPASVSRCNPLQWSYRTEDQWLAWFRGRRVTMSAELAGPKDPADPLFGFFDRPTKAQLVDVADDEERVTGNA